MIAGRFISLLLRGIVLLLAAAGAFFIFSYLAIRFQWTKETGQADPNSRYFSQIREQYDQGFRESGDSVSFRDLRNLERLVLLNRFYPFHSGLISDALESNMPASDISGMLDELDIALLSDSVYLKNKAEFQRFLSSSPLQSGKSVFAWMNIAEWQDFKIAVAKDKYLIDSAGRCSGVEPRLIVACLVGEQIRLFNSSREAYKRWIGPLKILSVESQFSFGVTGIKEATAIQIESRLKDSLSVFYPGKEFGHLLDFSGKDPVRERIQRLTSFRNHYYSYLYAGLFLRQVMLQWERAGFSIQHRPEILATLFNIGFGNSRPKANPEVGGALITIKDKEYTFGAIASQFYYSGELMQLFPYRKEKFQ
jgi:hypothetical protein